MSATITDHENLRKALKVKKLIPIQRKVLCLLAAYADAGNNSPSFKQMYRQLLLTPMQFDITLDHLQRKGHLKVDFEFPDNRPGRRATSRRNIYTLTLP